MKAKKKKKARKRNSARQRLLKIKKIKEMEMQRWKVGNTTEPIQLHMVKILTWKMRTPLFSSATLLQMTKARSKAKIRKRRARSRKKQRKKRKRQNLQPTQQMHL
jgi:hypothetical protein